MSSTGVAGPWSERVEATVLSNLAAPVLTATAAVGQITLTWQTVTDADGYEIWVHYTGTEWQKADDGSLTGTSTSFTHSSLTAGTTYYYQGRTLDANDAAGAWSLPVHATVPTPIAAPILTLTPAHEQITISWQAVTAADTYELWTWQEGGAWEQLDDGTLTATSFTHANLTVGDKHYYAIRGLNNDGAEGAWSEYVGAIAAGELPTPVLTAAAGHRPGHHHLAGRHRRQRLRTLVLDRRLRLGPARRRQPHRHHLHPHRPHRRHHLLLQPPRPRQRRQRKRLVRKHRRHP